MLTVRLLCSVRKGKWYIALAAAAAMLASASIRAADRPNILFILADDLGYGDPGCYGQTRILTPSIDRIASEGMRFTQAYAGSTVCAPSRCSLMTGLHTGHATVRGNKRPELGLRAGEPDVSTLLKAAGYSTVLVGKWGLGGPGTGSVPNLRGFDQFFGYLDQLHAHNYYPGHLWENQDEFFLTSNARPLYPAGGRVPPASARHPFLHVPLLHAPPRGQRTRPSHGERDGSAE
jgi:arylsulfatase A-like enzyme